LHFAKEVQGTCVNVTENRFQKEPICADLAINTTLLRVVKTEPFKGASGKVVWGTAALRHVESVSENA
jgi:hypothetical protein